MTRRELFESELQRWLQRWLDEGIIDGEQRKAMLASLRSTADDGYLELPKEADPSVVKRLRQARESLHRVDSQDEKKSVIGWLPGLLIGLAVVLLGVGIMLFYASNWRYMPSELKLLQVFCLVIGTYGGSYYLLAIKGDSPGVGRALLLLGMISFGAAISLVAQIFHISAHPTTGVLVWCLGVMAMSWVMKERWGAYLAFVLCGIWTFWEWGVYLDPNWLLPIVAAALIVLFYVLREQAGIMLTCVLVLAWVGFAEGHWLYQHYTPITSSLAARSSIEAVFVVVSFLAFPFGLCLILLGRWLEGQALFHWTSRLLTLVGWLLVYGLLLGFSWPIPIAIKLPFADPLATPVTLQYITLLGTSAGLLFWQMRRGLSLPFVPWLLVLGVIFPFVPIGDKRVLMTFFHVALLAFLFAKLYFSYRTHQALSLERFLAIAFVIFALFAKCIGLTTLGLSQSHFFVAYLLGFVIFGTVCFLGNQMVRLLLEREEIKYPVWMISVCCGLFAYISLYSLSFKLSSQRSVMEAKAYILVLLFAFIGLSLALYGYLLRRSPDTMPLKLSGVLFLGVVAILFTAGPSVSWGFYSIAFNLMLFVLVGTLIAYSASINSKSLANLAVAGFVLQMVTRYFDLLWNMLSGSVLFLATGALVLAGGYFLEKNRRKLLELIEQGEQSGRAAKGGGAA